MDSEEPLPSHDPPPSPPSHDPPPSPPSHEAPPPMTDDNHPGSKFTKWRNIIGFWLFGLTNNYPYVIMLSAAFDIIASLDGNDIPSGHNDTNSSLYNDSCTLVLNLTSNTTSYKPRDPCQALGTAIILIADVLPTLFIKLTAPYWMHFIPYWIRVLSVVAFSICSFIIIAFSSVEPLILFGVICASIASGFGEITFLSLTARYHKSTVSAWSSGTGAAGVAGALVYAALTTFLSPKVTLLIQTCIPGIMLVAYLFILTSSRPATPTSPSSIQGSPPASNEGGRGREVELEHSEEDDSLLQENSHRNKNLNVKEVKLLNKNEAKHWLAHIKYIPHLFKYILPLFLVYFAEYAINQSLFELLYNADTHIGSYCMDQKAQYRWLQVVYQVGVFISRSSVSILYIRHYWVFSLLQVANFVFFFTAAIYLFLPSFWLTFVLVLYEGMLGGAVYVNAFYTISKEVPLYHREFSMGLVSVGDTLGITVAGVSAIFIHNFICGEFIGYAS